MANTTDLLRLPPELMMRISSNLTTHELACFRHTCKQVETNLFESFAREFFTKRQFMLEEVSIQALVGIANHKTLAPYLKEVIISVEKLRYDSHGMLRGYDSVDAFRATGRAHVLLTEAFSNLPNLGTIGIRDYNGKGRLRDGDNASWKSYGWSLGDQPLEYPRHRISPETILPLILHSLDATSTKLERIEVFLRRNRIPDTSFDISLDFMRSKAVPVLSKLKALLLSLSDRPVDIEDKMASRGTDFSKRTEHAFPRLKDFLQHTSLLEHLRLNFAPGGITSSSWRTDGLLDWLGTPPEPGHTMVPTPVTLEHLTTLELGMVYVVPRILLNIVSKFAKLEALSLWKVTLQQTQNDPADIGRDGNSLWSHYLPELGRAFQAPENVKTLTIGWLSVCTDPYGVPTQTRFAGKTNVDSNGIKTFEDVQDVVKYRKRVGSNAREWLEELGEKAFLLTVEAYSTDNSDGGVGDSEISEDEEEDDEDDDDDDEDDDDDDNE